MSMIQLLMLIPPVILPLGEAAISGHEKAGSDGREQAVVISRPWLSADGREAGSEKANPDSAMAWAGLLVREESFSAASRSYENLVRRWPGAPVAEKAMLESAECALRAGEYDRAVKLVREMRERWLEGDLARKRDLLEVRIGEKRLAAIDGSGMGPGRIQREARAAFKVFAGILKRERFGIIVERATLGRARALYRMGSIARAIHTLEVFLREFPRSDLSEIVRRDIADMRSGRARNRSAESQVLEEQREDIDWILKEIADDPAKTSEKEIIRETFKAIARRQAELKIREARLYLKLRKVSAAEHVLRTVLRRYGETPSAAVAAEMLEELAGRE